MSQNFNLPNHACWSPCTSIASPKSASFTAAPFILLASNRFSGWNQRNSLWYKNLNRYHPIKLGLTLHLNGKRVPSNPCARYHLCGSDWLTLESVVYNEMHQPQSRTLEQRYPQTILHQLLCRIEIKVVLNLGYQRGRITRYYQCFSIIIRKILTSQKQDNENFLLEWSRVTGLKKK